MTITESYKMQVNSFSPRTVHVFMQTDGNAYIEVHQGAEKAKDVPLEVDAKLVQYNGQYSVDKDSIVFYRNGKPLTDKPWDCELNTVKTAVDQAHREVLRESEWPSWAKNVLPVFNDSLDQKFEGAEA
jgi:hypothetical protein